MLTEFMCYREVLMTLPTLGRELTPTRDTRLRILVIMMTTMEALDRHCEHCFPPCRSLDLIGHRPDSDVEEDTKYGPKQGRQQNTHELQTKGICPRGAVFCHSDNPHYPQEYSKSNRIGRDLIQQSLT